MPGLNDVLIKDGKRRKRRTPYHPVNVRLRDFYGLHRLSSKLGIPLVDVVHLLVTDALEANHIDPAMVDDIDETVR